MKKAILSIALLASVISSLSSCAVTQERRGHRGHDRGHGRHHGPYDSNYRNYHKW
jgi:hypothetical protein